MREIAFGGGLRALEWKPAVESKNASASTSSPKILLLHGWLDNAASFDALAPTLARDLQATVVGLDFHGHGKSEARPLHPGFGYVRYYIS